MKALPIKLTESVEVNDPLMQKTLHTLSIQKDVLLNGIWYVWLDAFSEGNFSHILGTHKAFPGGELLHV